VAGARAAAASAPEPAASAAGAVPAAPAAATAGATESRKLAWYGRKFTVRKTASGEAYNPNALTMAHKTLPFGTLVKVANPKNGKSVTLRVNDRGPTQGDRVGDVSQAAARKLGMTKSGVLDAELTVVGKAAPKKRCPGPAKPAPAADSKRRLPGRERLGRCRTRQALDDAVGVDQRHGGRRRHAARCSLHTTARGADAAAVRAAASAHVCSGAGLVSCALQVDADFSP